MATKIKGIYKGFKYISQIFVVTSKDRELEIGNPTDVKHVAHIGWDGPSGSAPNWMNEFKSGPEFSASSLGSVGETRESSSNALSKWSSQDSEESLMHQPEAGMNKTLIPPDLPKKHKRRKSKTNSSHKSSSTRSPKKGKSKASIEAKMNIQVV